MVDYISLHISMVDCISLHIVLMNSMKVLPKLTYSRVLSKKLQLRESKVFSKSIERRIPGNLLF